MSIAVSMIWSSFRLSSDAHNSLSVRASVYRRVRRRLITGWLRLTGNLQSQFFGNAFTHFRRQLVMQSLSAQFRQVHGNDRRRRRDRNKQPDESGEQEPADRSYLKDQRVPCFEVPD